MAVVSPVASLGRSGVGSWLLQRASAVILLAYTLCILYFALTVDPASGHLAWQRLFGNFEMRLFSSVALAALAAHGWIGMWAVSVDYLTARALGRGAGLLRGAAQLAVIALSLAYLAYGLRIIWATGGV